MTDKVTTTLARAKDKRKTFGQPSRIVRLGRRLSDGAEMARLELIKKDESHKTS